MSFPSAEQTGNMVEMEMQWAVKAMHHAETYMKLLKTVGGKNFKLTPIDDELYEDFMENFADLNIATLDENDFKTEVAKAKWREFMTKYEHRVNDYNFGTLLRIDASGDYSEENSMFAMRTQFYCIEIARTRANLNDAMKE
ncbi:hypothetical protein GGI04_003556 [Coemansia thaxteri]|uniref:Polysaccharide biosynthesis domain-containing protein n=1 Tax=Coemansia thaxteri TaxID=2663907 RepID=A0A9W8EHK0_9FUNG|nr:hypothetical protein H4R26_005050 [Coemansia thaxteri]KAJ2001922.1 hypothetical protein GGI04_003556 [Coemansia thaxteri]KAJ2469333.1 hypothetical protein GGI02_003427 [Coemansia sp. RSA 2322]KAJ2478448.1 hypothetical protein EV174_004319 [Coemansia sp. RSA 2320]